MTNIYYRFHLLLFIIPFIKTKTVEYNFTKDDKDNEKVKTNNKTIFKVPLEEFLFYT